MLVGCNDDGNGTTDIDNFGLELVTASCANLHGNQGRLYLGVYSDVVGAMR